MNIEQERAELLPCPFCGGSVSFHRDDEECRDGCHYIECKTCGMFDLSTAADPANTIEDLGELRARIAPLWNRRAALQSQSNHDTTLFCDLKTDEEKYAFFLSGRGYETGVIARAIQNDVAMAYHRCAEYKKQLDALQSQDREDAERYRRLRKGDIDDVAVVRGLGAMDYGASAVIATYSEEIDGDDLDAAIDHARRAEGDGE